MSRILETDCNHIRTPAFIPIARVCIDEPDLNSVDVDCCGYQWLRLLMTNRVPVGEVGETRLVVR